MATSKIEENKNLKVMNEEKQSDVRPLQFTLFNEASDLIVKNYDYVDITKSIKNNIEYIFESYLEIGSDLLKVKKDKLYLLEDYKTIYEYTEKEFELSKTTTKNIISISERFSDKHGNLLDEYKGFTFSNLVELLSVDEKDIKSFTPSMTVKDVRSKKIELKINSLVDKELNENGFISNIINDIEYGPWDKIDYTYEISHTIKDFKFDSKIERWQQKNRIQIEFIIKIFEKEYIIDFIINLEDKKFMLTLNKPYYYDRFDDIDKINEILIVMSNLIKDDVNYFKAKNNENNKSNLENDYSEDISPGYYLVKKLYNEYSSLNFKSKIEEFISKLNIQNYYYESNGYGNNSITIFERGKRHKKNNPGIYTIDNLDDPFNFKITILATNKEIVIFEDFQKIFDEAMKKVKDNLIQL